MRQRLHSTSPLRPSSTNCWSEGSATPPSCRSDTGRPLQHFIDAAWPLAAKAITTACWRRTSHPPGKPEKRRSAKEPAKGKGRRPIRPPPLQGQTWLRTYFRLPSVRSAESLATKAAPHQFEPRPLGLIVVILLMPLAVKSLVNALQSPLLRSVS